MPVLRNINKSNNESEAGSSETNQIISPRNEVASLLSMANIARNLRVV